MTSFVNISKEFKTNLYEAIKDKKIDNNELNKLKNIASIKDEKFAVELLSKDTSALSKIFSNSKSEASISLGIDEETLKSNTKNSLSGDVEEMKINKYTPTKKNDDDFRRVFPNSNAVPLSLDKGVAGLITANVFEKTLVDFKKTINDKSNGFTAETFFKAKEYLAKQVNEINDLESADKLMKLLEKTKDFIPEINNDNRFKEIYLTTSLKKANYLQDKINNTTNLSELRNISNSIKDDKTLGNNSKRLNSSIDDISWSTFNKKIFESKNISDIKFIRKNLDDFKNILSPENYSKLEKELNSKSVRIIDSELKTLNDLPKAIEIFSTLKSLENKINKDSHEILSNELKTKTVKMLDNKIESIKTYDDYDSAKLIFDTIKKSIPESTAKLFENDLKSKLNVISIYGKEGVKGIDQSDIVQGNLNDCFFLSALIGLAHLRPEEIPKMIKSNHDGSFFTVKFPGAKESVTVSRPTKEEMGKYVNKSQNDDSIWAAVLEKAFAQYQNKGDLFGNYWHDNHYDAIDSGGLQSTGISALTGHSTDTDVLSLTSNSTIREKVQDNLKNKRTITLSSFADGDKSKNIAPNHVYTVLAYNKEKDTFIIRNPWGAGGEPSGGLKYNDNKRDGVFEVTMDELNEYFTLIAYEEEN